MEMLTLQSLITSIIKELHNNINYSPDEAKIESRFIVEHVLELNQKDIILNNRRPINLIEEQKVRAIVDKRIQGYPLPLLLGAWSFYGRPFKVNSNVLIPRSDTEVLIEKALLKINTYDTYEILDLGCGTGIIGLTLAIERPLSKITLIDQSEDALKNTKDNHMLHQTHNITIKKSDWFSALAKTKFDVIVSNPPYLEENDPHLLKGLEHEPINALISGPTGINAIQHIIENAKNHMTELGWLFIEHGYNQAEIVKNLFQKNGYQHIENAKDIHGIHRVTFGQYSIV
jgi:release factor glutamine methyltransferase